MSEIRRTKSYTERSGRLIDGTQVLDRDRLEIIIIIIISKLLLRNIFHDNVGFLFHQMFCDA